MSFLVFEYCINFPVLAAADMAMLRRSPLGNRAISIFSPQKPCTRIILSILQSFAFPKS